MIKRRSFIGALGSGLGLGLSPHALAHSQPVPLADAHSHIGLVQKTFRQARFVEQAKESDLALISWCVVPDGRWLQSTNIGIIQGGTPGKGQLAFEFSKQLSSVKAYLNENNVKIALAAQDIEAAERGELRVVLSSEGADFVEGDLSRLADAHQKGLRHTQLVHYIQSDLGDLQTIAPRHQGLTAFGRSVIQECNRLGILMDLAHCDAKTVEQALDVSTHPLIWSHGWYASTQGQHNDAHGILARRMSWDLARKIARKGGVIGLWSLGITDQNLVRYPEYPMSVDPGRRLRMYAMGMAQMVKELGADHVCFGTDMEGVGPSGVVNYYRELRQVANLLSDAGLRDDEIFKVCIGNYARSLKVAMGRTR